MKRKQKPKKKKSQNTTKWDISEILSDWLAFPPLIRKLADSEIEKLGLDKTEMNPDNPFLLIRTRTELAEKLHLDRKRMWEIEHSEEIQKRKREKQEKWGRSKTPNIIAGLYKATIIEGDAARVKLWFQFFEGWQITQKIKFVDENEEFTDEQINEELARRKKLRESGKEPDNQGKKKSS